MLAKARGQGGKGAKAGQGKAGKDCLNGFHRDAIGKSWLVPLKGSAFPATKVKGVKRNTDTTLGWAERDYPQLAAWRILAVEWLKGETRGVDKKLSAMVVFFERYIIQQGLPFDPEVFLARNTVLPRLLSNGMPGFVRRHQPWRNRQRARSDSVRGGLYPCDSQGA